MNGWKRNVPELKRRLESENGLVLFTNLPHGSFKVEVRHVGYEPERFRLDIPYSENQPIFVEMDHEHGHHLDHLHEIIVSTTRTVRGIEISPTRIEAIRLEEIEEKINISLMYDHPKLFLGYTYVDANQHSNGDVSQLPLNSPHQINAILMLVEHGSFRIGL